MSLDSTTEVLMRKLARAVARGRTVTAWARNCDVSIESAHRFTELPEFRDTVEKIRLEHAEGLVGKIGRSATGPRPESWTRTRFNGLKHGMRSKAIVLPNEDTQELVQQLKDWIESVWPRTKMELALAVRTVLADWNESCRSMSATTP
jgi:hypothetical protein